MENLVLKKNIYYFLTFVILAGTAISISGCKDTTSDKYQDEMVAYAVIGAKVSLLDPAHIGDSTSSLAGGQIFECLYEYHYLKRPYELMPCLAADMPTVSDDGLIYTIPIKKGVYFTDDVCFADGKGREVVASDFIYAWKRIADIKNISQNWWIFDGKIKGFDEFREYTKSCATRDAVDYSLPVEGLQAVDNQTLRITLNKPWPQMLYILAHLPTAPMAREAVEYYGKSIINHPVGTGAYLLKKWNRGSYLEFERNPSYRKVLYPDAGEASDLDKGFLADAGKRLPFVDRLFMMVIQEDPPAWFSFLQGKLDLSGIPKDNFSQAIDAGKELTGELIEKGIELKVYQRPTTYWVGFNMSDELIGGNKPLRQAISAAIDRATYVDLFTNNRAEVAYGFLPPLMKAYDKDIENYGISYDIEKARQFVKEAEGLYGGAIPKLKMGLPSTDVVTRQMGQFYTKAFKDVGLELEVDYMDWPTYIGKQRKKQMQIFQSGWIADYPDAENFLQLFYSKNVWPGINSFNYVNPEFDAIFEKTMVMRDCPERQELYKKAQKIIVEDCPAAFLLHGVAFTLQHDWIKNFKPNVFQYGITKYRRIDTAKRLEYQRKYN